MFVYAPLKLQKWYCNIKKKNGNHEPNQFGKYYKISARFFSS